VNLVKMPFESIGVFFVKIFFHWLRIETNEKALEWGREEGEKIAMEKATLNAARILKQQGVAPSIIALSTGLSESVIDQELNL
jgi:hypothetical protein